MEHRQQHHQLHRQRQADPGRDRAHQRKARLPDRPRPRPVPRRPGPAAQQAGEHTPHQGARLQHQGQRRRVHRRSLYEERERTDNRERRGRVLQRLGTLLLQRQREHVHRFGVRQDEFAQIRLRGREGLVHLLHRFLEGGQHAFGRRRLVRERPRDLLLRRRCPRPLGRAGELERLPLLLPQLRRRADARLGPAAGHNPQRGGRLRLSFLRGFALARDPAEAGRRGHVVGDRRTDRHHLVRGRHPGLPGHKVL